MTTKKLKKSVAQKAKATSFVISPANMARIDKIANVEERGNRSAWLDKMLTEHFKGTK